MNTIIRILKGLKIKVGNYPGLSLCLIMLLLGCTIYQSLRIYSLSKLIPDDTVIPEVVINTSNGDVQTRTSIFANSKQFTPVPSFSQKLLPNKLTYWDTPTVLPNNKAEPVEEASHKDSITGTSLPLDLSRYYYRDFLGDFSLPDTWLRSNDSVVQFLISRKNLTLTTFNPAVSKFSTNEYNLDFERYRYNWQPSTGLTREKHRYFSVQPYIQGRYQPFHNVMNLGAGISFKTRKLDYNLGVHLNRDVRVNPKIYPDLEVSITYYPIKWQR